MDTLWGKIMWGLVESTKKLTEHHWKDIIKECKPYVLHHAQKGPGDVQLNRDHSDLDRGLQRSELHALIQIDW